MDYFSAFRFLQDHPVFRGAFTSCLAIEVVKVDPTTKRIEADDSHNTQTQVWLECGPADLDEEGHVLPIHDCYLDCGGETFEAAIVELAMLVEKKYGGVGSPDYLFFSQAFEKALPIERRTMEMGDTTFPYDEDDETIFDDDFDFSENPLPSDCWWEEN